MPSSSDTSLVRIFNITESVPSKQSCGCCFRLEHFQLPLKLIAHSQRQYVNACRQWRTPKKARHKVEHTVIFAKFLSMKVV